MGLQRWPLVCLLSLCVLRLGAGMQLTEELDSLLCPSLQESPGKIIDVHKSLQLGAELLDGSWTASLEQCVSECCHKPGCDLALYKNDGVSQSGKNCYYIKCLLEENCVMVDHGGFTSVVFRLNKNNEGDGNKPDGSERTGHDPPTSPPSSEAPPTTTATPTTTTRGSNITKEESSSTTTPPVESHSDSKPSSNPSSGTGSTSSETPTTKQSSEAVDEVGAVDKSVLSQDKGRDGNGGVNDCGKHGCDGSGVIAIVVVASICFVIIVLVVAVLLRKVITDNRRKRFKNVDYLINGMYT